jgi:hypothetical protein
MKTTKLIAMSMALCLGATSAFGQVSKVEVAGGSTCSTANPIPTSVLGIDANDKVTCIIGDNVNGSDTGLMPACWASEADASVWYSFSIPDNQEGYWTISTDNGIKVFDTDAQIALYDACGSQIGCNEDLGNESEVNTLASGLTIQLKDSTTYYLQVDVFGTATGKFALTILKNDVPASDCIVDASNIQNAYDGLATSNFSADGWFVYNQFAYDAAAEYPCTAQYYNDGGLKSDDEANCNANLTYNDVWLKFEYDESKPALLNVYGKNDWPFYGVQVFDSMNTPSSCGNIGNELDYLGCSLGDGSTVHGGSEDWAIGDFLNHPRVNLDELTFATSGPKHTLYVRVYQYSRILIGDTTGNLAAPPSEGLFKVAFETIDGDNDNACSANVALKLNDNCDGAGFNFSGTFTNLSNAGTHGGLSAFEGSTAPSTLAGRANEPTEFVVANGTTRADFNCDGDTLITGGKVLYNNNSTYCRFSVEDAISSFNISDYSEILRVTVPIDDALDPEGVLPEEVRVILDLCDGVGLGTDPDTSIPGGNPLCDSSITTVCGADVSFRFSNLNYCGPNGAVAEFYVIPANDTCTVASRGSVAAAFGELPDNSCDDCLEMGPSSFYLPTGDYFLVVDGDDGSLVNFDLELNIGYFIPGTIIPCELGSCNATGPKRSLVQDLQTKKLAEIGFVPTTIAPQPAKNFVNITYNAGREGMVQYMVLNMTGQTIDQGSFAVTEGEGVKQFDTSDFAPGMYAYTMILDGVRTQFKLMKQ